MIKGITFDEQSMSSANMAHFAYAFMAGISGVTKGCEVTASGSALNISAGYFFAHGRQVQTIGSTQVTAPTVQSGTVYARLVFTIDLNVSNTASAFNQGYFEVLTNATKYPDLIQQDLDTDGKKYQMPFAKMMIGTNGITNLTDDREVFATKFEALTKITKLTLSASGWSGKTQTKTVEGIKSTSYPDWYYDGEPTEAQYEAFCMITSMKTNDGSVTFGCAGDTPTVDVPIMIRGL